MIPHLSPAEKQQESTWEIIGERNLRGHLRHPLHQVEAVSLMGISPGLQVSMAPLTSCLDSAHLGALCLYSAMQRGSWVILRSPWPHCTTANCITASTALLPAMLRLLHVLCYHKVAWKWTESVLRAQPSVKGTGLGHGQDCSPFLAGVCRAEREPNITPAPPCQHMHMHHICLSCRLS